MTAGRTLGQFYPVASLLHGLDPRAKILGTAALAVGLFLVDSAAGFLLISAVVVLLVAASRVPPGTFVGFLRPVAFIVALTALFQVFFFPLANVAYNAAMSANVNTVGTVGAGGGFLIASFSARRSDAGFRPSRRTAPRQSSA